MNLSGRFIVLMPDTDIITVSQKIENENTRQKLVEIAKKNLPENTGAILRTSSENASEDEIKNDIEELYKTWGEIKKKATNSKNCTTIII